MEISQKGIDLIKQFEGCKLIAYQDIVGVWTIGYGHTYGVYKGMSITQQEAENLLREDLKKYESNVRKYDSTYNWNQNEFDALVSFAFNIGNIDKLTDYGKRSITQIANKIPEYCHAGGKVVKGLVDRRNKEKELFLTGMVIKNEKTSLQKFIDHFENLYNTNSVYLWGANCEIIDIDLINKLIKNFGSSKYDSTYYMNKYAEGKGKIGADCSGAFYPLSKADNTAKGYYELCKIKGSIKNMDMSKPCMLFNSKLTHVGAYLGNGYTIEMKSSKDNCVKQKLNKTRWTYYGIPEWLNTEQTVVTKSKEDIAKEVLAGKWGNGVQRKTLLEKAGYDYNEIQKLVNQLAKPVYKKSNEEIAKEVISGQWGNGNDRKNNLIKAGYDYNEIQQIVNKLIKGGK